MRVFCNTCGTHTRHQVVKEHEQTFTPDDYPGMGVDWAHGTWQIIRCAGCEVHSFREVLASDDELDPETGNPAPRETLYPRRSVNAVAPKNLFNVPPTLRRLYAETVDAYNSSQPTLCAAGLRSLIEGICADKGVTRGHVERDGGTKLTKDLEGKIEGLHEKEILSRHHARTLHGLRFLGNAAVHELDTPSREDLKIGVEIVEHTLEGLYELPEKGEVLQVRNEKRKPRPKAPSAG